MHGCDFTHHDPQNPLFDETRTADREGLASAVGELVLCDSMADAPTSLGPAMGRTDEPDSRTSLRHILAEAPAMDASKPSPSVGNTPAPEDSEAGGGEGQGEGEGGRAPQPATITTTTTTTTTTRRVANGSVSSVYSGNKIKHLKKDDGMPLWRRDIQYDFLRLVFEDTQAVFTRTSDGTGGHTFADIYLDAMAHSSKCSKILKDKLLSERPAAINMAMVCLLVNVGRMNTTLNFFPEMRAQLRTYHSIPSLQAHQDPSAYKQLQDAPRLKSILKGATDDDAQPSTVDEIRQAAVPRTNPVNLIFVLSQYAPKVSELHFFPPRDFFDLVMRPTLSSRSRATARAMARCVARRMFSRPISPALAAPTAASSAPSAWAARKAA